MKDWFASGFPRFNFQDESLVQADEWERFARSEGIRFPECKLCPAMYTSNKDSAVILVRDAVHSFPPDLGEGVNCALADVAALDDALGNNQGNLEGGLEEFERARLPEVRDNFELYFHILEPECH